MNCLKIIKQHPIIINSEVSFLAGGQCSGKGWGGLHVRGYHGAIHVSSSHLAAHYRRFHENTYCQRNYFYIKVGIILFSRYLCFPNLGHNLFGFCYETVVLRNLM